MLALNLVAIHCSMDSEPTGVDIGQVREAATLNNDNGPVVRRKLAIDILDAASRMSDAETRTAEVKKLSDLYKFPQDDQDKEVLAVLKPLTTKKDPTREDCLDALGKLKDAPAKAKDSEATPIQRVKDLIRKAQTIALPADYDKQTPDRQKLLLAEQTAKRAKLLDEAAEIIKPKKGEETFQNLLVYRLLKGPANPNDNSELDTILSRIDRIHVWKPGSLKKPYHQTVAIILEALKEESIPERRRILESFKKDSELYKTDQNVKLVIDKLLATRLTDVDFETHHNAVLLPTFCPEIFQPNPFDPNPNRTVLPWYYNPWITVPGGIVLGALGAKGGLRWTLRGAGEGLKAARDVADFGTGGKFNLKDPVLKYSPPSEEELVQSSRGRGRRTADPRAEGEPLRGTETVNFKGLEIVLPNGKTAKDVVRELRRLENDKDFRRFLEDQIREEKSVERRRELREKLQEYNRLTPEQQARARKQVIDEVFEVNSELIEAAKKGEARWRAGRIAGCGLLAALALGYVIRGMSQKQDDQPPPLIAPKAKTDN